MASHASWDLFINWVVYLQFNKYGLYVFRLNIKKLVYEN